VRSGKTGYGACRVKKIPPSFVGWGVSNITVEGGEARRAAEQQQHQGDLQ